MIYKDHKKKYLQHRTFAKWRSILWLFNYITWWKKWCESGKWNERGRNSPDNYVMARYGDKGPYSYNNTKIITHAENTREAQLGRKHTEEAKRNMAEAKLGNKNSLGYKHTNKSKQKISKTMTNRKFSLEHRVKISNANRNRRLNKKSRAKISAANKGRVRSLETKAKMSNAQKLRRERER